MLPVIDPYALQLPCGMANEMEMQRLKVITYQRVRFVLDLAGRDHITAQAAGLSTPGTPQTRAGALSGYRSWRMSLRARLRNSDSSRIRAGTGWTLDLLVAERGISLDPISVTERLPPVDRPPIVHLTSAKGAWSCWLRILVVRSRFM